MHHPNDTEALNNSMRKGKGKTVARLNDTATVLDKLQPVNVCVCLLLSIDYSKWMLLLNDNGHKMGKCHDEGSSCGCSVLSWQLALTRKEEKWKRANAVVILLGISRKRRSH